MDSQQEEKKISWAEHNKILDEHIKRFEEQRDRREAALRELEDKYYLQQDEYKRNTPERLRRMNAENASKIADLQDLISDKDDLISLLRDEKRASKQKLDETRDTIAELNEELRKKTIVLKKYMNRK